MNMLWLKPFHRIYVWMFKIVILPKDLHSFLMFFGDPNRFFFSRDALCWPPQKFDQLPCPCWKKATLQHDAATTMLTDGYVSQKKTLGLIFLKGRSLWSPQLIQETVKAFRICVGGRPCLAVFAVVSHSLLLKYQRKNIYWLNSYSVC